MKRDTKNKVIQTRDAAVQPLPSGSTGKNTDESKNNWTDNEKIIRKEFPGPGDAIVNLRIAIDKSAYSAITEHVHKSLDAEVCGVLVGDFCEDDHGAFVHIQHIIEGSATQQGSAHVTFTQETWNNIHSRLEREFRNKRIVGWYHSHPGFGVTFSDMDLFIQKNFFSLPTQCALVIDPLGGDAALCINGINGPVYIERFWISGREKKLYIPSSANRTASTTAENSVAPCYREYLHSLEQRVNQVLQILDIQARSNSRIVMILLLVTGMVLTFCLGYTILKSDKQSQPPELMQYIPLPIKIGNDTALIGVSIVKWNIPPELLAMQLEFHEQEIRSLENTIRETIIEQSKKKGKKEGLFRNVEIFFKKLFSKKDKQPQGVR